MPVEVPCPHCQCLLKAPDGMAGKKARCKQCRATFEIPGEPPPRDDTPAEAENPFAFATPPTGRGVDKPTPVPADSPLPPDDSPFSLSALTAVPAEPLPAEAGPKPRPRAETKSKSHYQMKPVSTGSGSRRLILIAGLVGLVCATGAAAAVYVWLQSQQPPPGVTQSDRPPAADPPTAKPEKPAAKVDDPTSNVVKPAPKTEKQAKTSPPSKGGATVAGALPLPPPPADMVTLIQKPKYLVPLDYEAAKVRRVLTTTWPVVVWPLSAGFQKTGAVDAVDRYDPLNRAFVDRLEIPADGLTWPRTCHVSPSANKFASEGPAGKVTVWNLNDKKKILDAIDPPTGDGKGPSGVAAVYFAEENRVAVVGASGAMDVWNLKTKSQEITGTPIAGVSADRPLADRRTVAVTPDGRAVLALVGGTVHEIPTSSGKPKAALSLPRNPAEGYALAADGSGARVVAAYRATTPAPHVVAVVARLGDSKPAAVIPLADDIGVPVEAAWPGPETAVLVTDRGIAALIDGESNKLVATLRPGAHFPGAATGQHWCVLPDPANAKKAVLMSIPVPFQGYFELLDAARPAGLVVSVDGVGK